MIYNSNAYDSFDAVQVINTYQFNDMKEIIYKKKLKTKVFRSRYLFLRNQFEKKRDQTLDSDLIIVPSWNTSFYELQCHVLLKKFLYESDISYKIRPHPMSLKRGEILDHLSFNISDQNFCFPSPPMKTT